MSGSAEGREICIEVAFAESARAALVSFHVPPGASIADVLQLAAARPEFAGIDVLSSTVGIFGRIALLDRLLEDGDRVEIYRPLAVDPKEARRSRARQAHKKR